MSWASFTAWLGADPFLSYTLLAALFLAGVSLFSGWRRRDFSVLATPQGLLHVALAVLCAFFLLLLENALGEATGERLLGTVSWQPVSLAGVSRFPLYIVTLAYGPSAGLVAAGLFAAFTATGSLPGWPEAVLALELVVLGWFAIAPSPRTFRWAGPFDAGVAYLLAWATGGSALLQSLSGQGAQWVTHVSYHETFFWGVVISVLSLFLLSPKTYRDLFRGSSIGSRAAEPALPQTLSQVEAAQASQPSRSSRLKQTFVGTWLSELNELENPFRSAGAKELRLTPAPRGEAPAPYRKRRLSDLSLSELRARPKRRSVKAAPIRLAPLEEKKRVPRRLEPLVKDD